MTSQKEESAFRILTEASVIPDHTAEDGQLHLSNDADVHALALEGITCIALDFPKFTDGRAFSQAHLLRRRGFAGDIRATGDVLVDQLLQMQRSGFSSAVLREGQDAAHGARLLAHYSGFYQGDVQNLPHFARAA